MKINIDHTLEVTDEQRVKIANVLDGRITKRQATRDEMKQYIWERGSMWAENLSDDFRSLEEEPEEDLIGGDDEDDLEDLI